MKLIAQVKLQPTPDQADALLHTVVQTNAAANDLSRWAWDNATFGQYAIHKGCYYSIRAAYGLSAQVTVRVIAKVADAYKLDRRTLRRFLRYGSMAYDSRILAWNRGRQTVSIWTTRGRQTIPFQAGERQRALLQTRQGEADLVYRDGSFYLFQTCEVEPPPPGAVSDFLGVDLGITNIASDSDGTRYSGAQVNGLRARHSRLRRKLQKLGTKAAKALLRKRRRRESNFAKHTNHVIAKRVVARAERTDRGIALENLQGIRSRVRVRKAHRRQQHSWSFHDLAQKISYKAALAGVPVVCIDPRHTSQTCPACGLIDSRNRPNQSTFSCIGCGYSGHADTIAAVNIARKGLLAVGLPVNQAYLGAMIV